MHLRNIVATSFVGVVVKFIMLNMLNLLNLNVKLNGTFSIFFRALQDIVPTLIRYMIQL